jgi:hypothetical protein
MMTELTETTELTAPLPTFHAPDDFVVDDDTRAELFAFEAPYLVEKLVKDRIVDDPEEAEALFREVKRYLLLCRVDRSRMWQMHSLRVDHCWHELVLFTGEYIAFCRRFFGGYVPHSPSNAPEYEGGDDTPAATYDEFQARYASFFGEELPAIWQDDRAVLPHRRVINDDVGRMSVAVVDDRAELSLALHHDHDHEDDGAPLVLLRVNAFAADALAFIARTGAFYVRELPGDLDDDEKVDLVATLVREGALRVGT